EQLPEPVPQPGRPLITPGTPPSTTVPIWAPPVAPAPSQTNIPAPLTAPGTPGAPGTAGTPGTAGAPGTGGVLGTIGFRGVGIQLRPTLRLSEEYSDNFFQATSGAQDNFRTIFGPGFTLTMNGARTFATLSTTVDLIHDTAPDTGDDIKVFPSMTAAVRY